MNIINRAALVVRPRQPYLDWAAGLDEESAEDARDLDQRASVYLVPEDPTGERDTPPLDEFVAVIFEAELAAWEEDESTWPERRDLATFEAWFEVAGQPTVVDLSRDDLEVEAW